MAMRKRGLAVVALLGMVGLVMAAETPKLLDFKMKSLTGSEVELGQYAGKVLLIVNVASKCGATPQYEQLQALHEKYKDQGLVVIGFPCNQFGAQEPGSAADIASFCKDTYNVNFPMFDKVDVNGPEAAPIYKLLTAHEPGSGPIKWNFEKFLIGRDGKIVSRYSTRVKPDDKEVVKAIEAELAKK